MCGGEELIITRLRVVKLEKVVEKIVCGCVECVGINWAVRYGVCAYKVRVCLCAGLHGSEEERRTEALSSAG